MYSEISTTYANTSTSSSSGGKSVAKIEDKLKKQNSYIEYRYFQEYLLTLNIQGTDLNHILKGSKDKGNKYKEFRYDVNTGQQVEREYEVTFAAYQYDTTQDKIFFTGITVYDQDDGVNYNLEGTFYYDKTTGNFFLNGKELDSDIACTNVMNQLQDKMQQEQVIFTQNELKGFTKDELGDLNSTNTDDCTNSEINDDPVNIEISNNLNNIGTKNSDNKSNSQSYAKNNLIKTKDLDIKNGKIGKKILDKEMWYTKLKNKTGNNEIGLIQLLYYKVWLYFFERSLRKDRESLGNELKCLVNLKKIIIQYNKNPSTERKTMSEIQKIKSNKTFTNQENKDILKNIEGQFSTLFKKGKKQINTTSIETINSYDNKPKK